MVMHCSFCQAELDSRAQLAGRCGACGREVATSPGTAASPGQSEPSTPAPKEKGAGTWKGRALAQTIDIPANLEDVADAAPQPAQSASQDPRLTRTIAPGDVSESDADEPPKQPGTKTNRGFDRTIDVGLPPEDVARITGMWTVGAVEDVSPGMTIKGQDLPAASDSVPLPSDSSLVIKSRALRSQTSDSPARKLSDASTTPGASPDYEILEMLGKGGMGVVYAARQTSIYRTVAVKMLRPDMANDPEQRSKFLAEAAVTGDLDHPNIVPVYDLATNENGELFYSMKRVVGTPWSKVIAEKTQPENIEILLKVADAVAFAHNRGVLHRDLKPENVMLGDFGEVLLMDWGLAHSNAHLERVGSITQTSMGGTPAYMAPEMALGPIERIGTASDVYLLGAILYEIITGKPPHTGKDVLRCLYAAARNEIVPTNHTGELVSIALKAMSTAPGDRHADVRTLQQAIRAYQAHAESIAISARAIDDLAQAEQTGDYQLYSRAIFGLEEALVLWSSNAKAAETLARARLAYAHSALAKADFDLGLSLLDASNPAHASLLEQLRQGQRERDLRKSRLKTVKRVVVAMAAVIVVGATLAFLQIKQGRDRAVLAEGKAKRSARQAQTAASEARRAEKQARRSETKATQSAKLARQAEGAARKQKTLAEQARDAEEYQAYIARIGLAAAKIDENAFDSALAVLKLCKPHLRNWEWGRLMHLCRQSVEFATQGPVNSLDYSPDGQRFVTGSWDGRARIWSTTPGSAPLEIPYEGLYVQAVAFSPDGQYVALGGSAPGKFLQLFRADTGQLERTFVGHEDAVVSVRFSTDGRRLLTASYDKTAQLWDVEKDQALRVYQGHTWWVWDAEFSPDENEIATASQDGTCIVWSIDAQADSPLRVFNAHRGPVYSLAFAPDGKTIASTGYDSRLYLWNPADVQPFDIPRLAAGAETEKVAYRALDGHSAPVRSVHFSTNGELLLTAAQDNTLKIWNRETGRELNTLRGHGGWVYCAEFSPDGQWVLSGGHDQRARLWNIGTYEEVRVLQAKVLRGHTDALLAAAFSADGQQIATASRDRSLRTWQSATGQPLQSFTEGHDFLASNAIVSADSRTLVTSAADNTVRIWDVPTGAERLALSSTGRSAAIALSHDGRRVLTGGNRESASDEGQPVRWEAHLWDAQSGEHLQTLRAHASEVTAVAFSPDDQILLTADNNGHCQLWNGASAEPVQRLEGHSRKIVAAAFTPDGQRVLTASADNTVGQWQVADGRELTSLVLRHPEPLIALALSPDGSLALTSCEDGQVRLWRVDTAEVIRLLPDPASQVSSVAFSPVDHRALTVSAANGVVRLWNTESGQELFGPGGEATSAPFLNLGEEGGSVWSAGFTPDGRYLLTVGGSGARLWELASGSEQMSFSPNGAVSSVAFAPDGQSLASGSWDNSIKIWDTQSGHSQRKLAGRDAGRVNSVVYSSDGVHLLSASDDGVARIWNAADGTLQSTLDSQAGPMRCAVYSADGRRIVTGSNDKLARIWNVETGQVQRDLAGHTWAVLSVAISRDGRRVATGSDDATARLWDASSGECVWVLQGHTASVTSVALSPDGRRVLTGSRDATCKLWDTETGKEILTLTGHAQEVTAVAFAPDGKQILTTSRDGTAILWLASDWATPKP